MLESIQDLINNLSGNYQKESPSPLCSIDETQLMQVDFKGIVNDIASLSDEKRHSGVFELAKNQHFRCYIPFAINCTVTIDEEKNRYIYNFGMNAVQCSLVHLQRSDATKAPQILSKEYTSIPARSGKFVSNKDSLLLDQFDSPSLLIIDELSPSSYAAVFRHDIQAYAGIFLNDLSLSRLMYSLRILSYCKGPDVAELLTRYKFHPVQAIRDEAIIGLQRLNAAQGAKLPTRQPAQQTA